MIVTLGAAIGAGKTGTVDFDVMTPATEDELPVMEELVLDDAGTKFGEIQLALTVVPGLGPEGESADGSEDAEDVTGGCNASGGNAGWLLLLAFAGLRGLPRRRRVTVP